MKLRSWASRTSGPIDHCQPSTVCRRR
jgi:hypothetical protein